MTDGFRGEGRRHTIDSGGVPIAVTEYAAAGADATPVVLLHGIGSRAQSWWPVTDPLAARYRLFVVDLRGHGASGKPEAGYLFDDYAADLDAILDTLALERPRIVGASLGALIALIWASTRPERAAALVLEDPSLRTQPEILGAFDGWQALAALPLEQAAAWYRQQNPEWSDEDCLRRAEAITSTAPGVFTELRAAAAAALASGLTHRMDLLGTIATPALLVHGNPALGSMVLPEDAQHFVQTMPRARKVLLPTAGHNLHREAADEFLAEVIPFLDGEGW